MKLQNKIIVVVIIAVILIGLGLAYKSPKKTLATAKCPENSSSFSCFQDYYTDVVKTLGVSEAFAELKEDYQKNPYIVSQCHPLTHVLGHAATELYPDVFESFAHGDPFCWSGYYHGVMEAIVEKVGLGEISTKLDHICDGIADKKKYGFDYYNCVHGLGHGLMAVSEDDVIDSLDICDNLTGDWEQKSCYGGVFMENVIIDSKGEYTKYLKPSDPIYPCNIVKDRYKNSCYLMQTSYMLKVVGGNFSKVFDLCNKVDTGYKDICLQSLGRDASGRTSSNAEKTKDYCYLGKDFEEKSNCIIGAVKDFISYFHSDSQAKDFCNSLSSDLKGVCLDTTSSYYKSF